MNAQLNPKTKPQTTIIIEHGVHDTHTVIKGLEYARGRHCLASAPTILTRDDLEASRSSKIVSDIPEYQIQTSSHASRILRMYPGPTVACASLYTNIPQPARSSRLVNSSGVSISKTRLKFSMNTTTFSRFSVSPSLLKRSLTQYLHGSGRG